MNIQEMNEEFYKFIFKDENNVEKEYEILLTFKSDKYNKIFYVMTDNTLGENNKLNTYAFYVNDVTNTDVAETDPFLYPVDDEIELESVYEVFNKVQKEFQ